MILLLIRRQQALKQYVPIAVQALLILPLAVLSVVLIAIAHFTDSFYRLLSEYTEGLITQVKIPQSSAPRLSDESRVENLKRRMKRAVDAENFELAATLREQIKELEGDAQNG